MQLLGKIFHYPEPSAWSAGENAVLEEQQRHREMLSDLTRWEPYRSLAPPPTQWTNNLRNHSNVFGPAPDAEERDAADEAKAYEWTADVKTAGQAKEALDRWASQGKPFFLGVGFYKPHVPLVAPQRFFDLYPPDEMPLPPDFAPGPSGRRFRPPLCASLQLGSFPRGIPDRGAARQAMAAYYACISFMDEKLGEVLDTLDRLNLRDNTVIVLWGDHGWHLGEKGMWGKGTLFDVSARVPLIMVDPRKPTRGQVCPRTVEFVDIYPTLVELCGLAMPPGLEGRSLVPLLDQPRAEWNKPAFTLVAREDWLGRSVRTERWCYTEWDSGRRGVELYDLQADPSESHNLAKDAEFATVIAELKQLLQTSRVAARVPLGERP